MSETFTDLFHTCKGVPNYAIEWRWTRAIPDGAWMLWSGDCFLDITYCPHCGVKLEPPQRINP